MEQTKPLVSIIVPIYNVELYLRECLESIQRQTLKDIEVIMVNDGSTDHSRDIAVGFAESDPRFHLIERSNGGISAARNTGLESVRGDFFLFVDSDDYIGNDLAAKTYQFATENECDLVVFGFTQFCDTGVLQKVIYQNAPTILANESDYWQGTPPGLSMLWNKLYRSSVYHNLSFPNGKVHEDEFVYHKIIHSSRLIGIIPESLYFYRKRPHSITASSSAGQRLIKMEACIGRVLYFSQEKNLTPFVSDAFKDVCLLYIMLLKDSPSREVKKSARQQFIRTRHLSLSSVNTRWLKGLLVCAKTRIVPSRLILLVWKVVEERD